MVAMHKFMQSTTGLFGLLDCPLPREISIRAKSMFRLREQKAASRLVGCEKHECMY